MNLDKFTGSGSTPSRRRFWDKVQQAVMASRKTQGRNASVDEQEGQGTVISFPDQKTTAITCPSSITLVVSGVLLDCGCLATGSSSSSEVTDNGSVNGTIIIPLFSDLGFACEYTSVIPGSIHIKDFFTVNDCSGSPNFENDYDVQVTIFLNKSSGVWSLEMQSSGTLVGFDLFLGDSTDPSSIANTVICQCSFLPCGFAHDGTAVITF